MDIDRFVSVNEPTWDRLAALTARANRGVRRMPAAELDELVRLYQRASTHLSYARTNYRDPALAARLTGLVAAASAAVYGARRGSLRSVLEFFRVTFPAAVWHARRAVLVSGALFLLPALALGVWLANSDRAVEASAPPEVREAYVAGEFEDYYSSEPAAEFATAVFTNNIRVAFLCFAAGILLCVFTAYLLVMNGANLGLAGGLFAAAGQTPRFFGLILPHGLLEISALVIAAAAGLRLGWAVVAPGDRTRRDAVAEEGRRSVVIVLGLVVAFFVAGLMEGFVTGRPWSTAVRVGIGTVVWVTFVLYIVVQGRAAAALGRTGLFGEDEPRRQSRPVALTFR
jgi:uncharacterized membrane protein SpoIIM required for sporulation